MPERSDALTRALAVLGHAHCIRRRPKALIDNRMLQTLVADLIAARASAGMTQHDVAMQMWTTKSAVSRLESGRFACPNLDTSQEARRMAADHEARIAALKPGSPCAR